jgi:hypothetical protein
MSRKQRGQMPDRDDQVGQLLFLMGLLIMCVVIAITQVLR